MICRQASRSDPASDRDDQAHLLGERDEDVRADDPALGVTPAQQRLHAADLAAGQAHDRLIVDLKLAGRHRALQVGAQFEPLEHLRVHLRLEQAIAALALALGDVHRRVGVADQFVGVGGGVPVDDGETKA